MRIGLLSQKGGVAKTTLAVNLAAALADEGKSVLLVDADPQASATAWANHREAAGLPALTRLKVVAHTAPDLHKMFKAPEKATGGDFGHAVIDGPPRADEALARSIIAACDIVLIPIQPSAFDIWAGDPTIRLVKAAQASGVNVKGALVLTRVMGGTNAARELSEVAGKKAEKMGFPLLSATTHNRTAYIASLSSCQTVFEYEARGPAATEIKEILAAVRELK